jgi:BMFP domain-containing protein YqiC
MQSDNRLFDDLARLAGGALNAFAGLKTEIEAIARQQFEQFLGTLNLVTREEFEAVQALAAKARDDQEALAERVAALEASLVASRAAGGAKPGRKGKAEEPDQPASP